MSEPYVPLPPPEPLHPSDTVQLPRDESDFDEVEDWRCPQGHRLREWWPASKRDGMYGFCRCGRVTGIWGTRDSVLGREEA